MLVYVFATLSMFSLNLFRFSFCNAFLTSAVERVGCWDQVAKWDQLSIVGSE